MVDSAASTDRAKAVRAINPAAYDAMAATGQQSAVEELKSKLRAVLLRLNFDVGELVGRAGQTVDPLMELIEHAKVASMDRGQAGGRRWVAGALAQTIRFRTAAPVPAF